jgi:hypothetical protein
MFNQFFARAIEAPYSPPVVGTSPNEITATAPEIFKDDIIGFVTYLRIATDETIAAEPNVSINLGSATDKRMTKYLCVAVDLGPV